MPTEHEFKFLLRRDRQFVESLPHIAKSTILIQQGYLYVSKGLSVRLRQSKKIDRNHWTLTIKKNTLDRTIEIEQEVDERDACDLWGYCDHKLHKHRHLILDDIGRLWEVDVFQENGNGCYCVLAEIELPEKSPCPTDLPDFISDNLVFAVPLGDHRFSNKKLSDVRHSKKLYERLEK